MSCKIGSGGIDHPMARLPTPWIDAINVHPSLFINRRVKLQEFIEKLCDEVDYKKRHGLVVIRGDRGVGKSIFVRKALSEIEKERPGMVISVIVDHRGSDDRQILLDFARKLVQVAQGAFSVGWRKDWLEPLSLLISAGDRLTRATTNTGGREYGSSAEISTGLWGVLEAKFAAQWKKKSEQSQKVEFSLDITPEVMRVALMSVLNELSTDFTVVVFYDDLDQAQNMDNAEKAKSTFRVVLDIGPCISILHLRTEVAGFADFRREVDRTFALEGLKQEELLEVLKGRVAARPGPHQKILENPAAMMPFQVLARATDNPYVLLRWSAALAEQWREWPPPPDWTEPLSLRRLAIAALNGPQPDHELLNRLGEIIDRLDSDKGMSEEDLLRGKSVLDNSSAMGLNKDQLVWLLRYELLVPVDRFDPKAGLRMDLSLRLIRPSVAKLMKGE